MSGERTAGGTKQLEQKKRNDPTPWQCAARGANGATPDGPAHSDSTQGVDGNTRVRVTSNNSSQST